MKTAMQLAIALVVCLGLASADADAKRLGGGRSIGAQRSAPTQVQKQAAPSNPQAAPAPTPAPAGNRWLGPLAGIAAGLGLAALFAHGGFGSIAALLLPLLLLIAGFVLWRRFRAAPAPQPSPLRYAGAGPELRTPAGYETQVPPARVGALNASDPTPAASAAPDSATGHFPPGFEPAPFLKHAKTAFVNIQAAFDRADFETLNDLLTPEMLSETRTEIGERGALHAPTEIVTLEATPIEVVEEGLLAWASVHFSGMIREEPNADAQPFDEVWNLQKPLSGASGWRLAGIQQLN